jgi:hypothetical protein
MKEKFHLFWNVKGRLKVWKTFFSCFQVEKKITSMYKISCLHPTKIGHSLTWCDESKHNFHIINKKSELTKTTIDSLMNSFFSFNGNFHPLLQNMGVVH